MKISEYTIRNLIKIISIYLNKSEKETEESLKEYLDFLDSLEVIYDNLPGTQMHHIIPRCLYNYSAIDEVKAFADEKYLNTWESGNLVRVTINDHIRCHEMLYNSTHLGKLAHALGFVTHFNKDYPNSEAPEEFAKELRDIRHDLFIKNVNSKEAVLKRNETHLRKYGTINGAMLTPEAKDKARKTKIEKYGRFQPNGFPRKAIDNSHLPEAIAKRKATIEARYGENKPWHSKESGEKKAEKTGMKILRLSVTDASILETIRSKREASRLYGRSVHTAIWKGTIYLGNYWVMKDNYDEWYRKFNEASSTTIETTK